MSESNIPSSGLVFNTLLCFQISAALRSAIEIDLFTAIADGHTTADAMAVRCKVNARGMRILADHLVINGFLTKRGNTYGLTAESSCYLVRHSPHYVGRQAEFMQSSFLWALFDHLTQAVREGGAQLPGNAMEPDHDLWVTFARVMSDSMGIEAALVPPIIYKLLERRTAQPLKILDVAAGHGRFGIAFAKADPTCRVVAQDWPRILEVTRDNVLKHGVSDRFTTIAGGIMEVDIGTGYDVVLIPNLIHYLDRASSVQILKKVRAAMNPGALLAIAEFAPNDDRVSTPQFASYALFCLAISPAGDAYTVSEIFSMCTEAGFKNLSGWELSRERLLVGTNPDPVPGFVVSTPTFSWRNGDNPPIHSVPHTVPLKPTVSQNP
jgi:2-polyprenyl-3-methyl-5-hydroxy-6-metoxy-1,4-benzoquinol methylase